jgi:O-antigen ligase
LVELGIFGFAPYLFIFIALLVKSIRMYWQLPWCRMLIGGMLGITAAYVIMSMAVELRIVLYPNVLFFTLWAMFLEVIRRQATLRQTRDIVHQKVVSFV